MLLILNTITILIVLVRMLIRLVIFNYNTLSVLIVLKKPFNSYIFNLSLKIFYYIFKNPF